MNRSLAVLTIGIVAALGLTACSSAAPEEPSTPPASSAAPAPVETEPAADAPDAAAVQACLELSGPLAEASTKMAAITADDTVSAQETVDAWTALVDAIGSVAGSATDAGFQAAAETAHTDIAALRDLMQKVYVDGDLSAAGEFATATQTFQTSYSALLAYCQG